MQGCFNYFARALIAVAMISKYGKEKYAVDYSDENWARVDGAIGRYKDADARHLLGPAIDGAYDSESKLLHSAHHAWDALAALELELRGGAPLKNPNG